MANSESFTARVCEMHKHALERWGIDLHRPDKDVLGPEGWELGSQSVERLAPAERHLDSDDYYGRFQDWFRDWVEHIRSAWRDGT